MYGWAIAKRFSCSLPIVSLSVRQGGEAPLNPASFFLRIKGKVTMKVEISQKKCYASKES